jgi:SAM-dependent methyltransferase
MSENVTFDRLVGEALAAPFEGWDFSCLKGRKTEADLPWDYCATVRARMKGIGSMLDMGTGGGEILASLGPFPPNVCATEAYARNVPVARARLEPLGVTVLDISAEPGNRRLPFGDAEFDLVVNRHEEYVEDEVGRILKPGGCFVTQQCGGYGENDLIEYFKGRVDPMDWSAAVASRRLRDAGFRIVKEQEVYPEYSFLDIGAVVYYLRAIPWLLNDFTVEKYRDRLLAMHKHIQAHGRFGVKDQKFLIEAVKL